MKATATSFLSTSFFQEIQTEGTSFFFVLSPFFKNTLSLKIEKECRERNLPFLLFFPPEGEAAKAVNVWEAMITTLLEKKWGKETVCIAVGGGSILDLSSFFAATFLRGIPLFFVPTTFLAMVDACIGGKAGLNTSFGKNLIGTFYFPKQIFIDTSFLSTLPFQELFWGMGEVIKHALIADPLFFTYLEKNMASLLQKKETLTPLILKNLEIKRNIVEEDPFEKGKRKLLNLGHTLGHALEKISHYKVSHGKAVCWGLLKECALSHSLGYLPLTDFLRIQNFFIDHGFIYHPEKEGLDVNSPSFQEALLQDKKCIVLKDGVKKECYIFLKGIGNAFSREGVFAFPKGDSPP